MKIHDPTNRALLIGTEKLKDTINTLWAALGGSVRIQFVDDLIYLNDTRLRMDSSVKEQIDALRQEFSSRGLGGLSFARPVDTAALRSFLVLFAQQPESEEGLVQLRKSLEELKDLALELLGPKSIAPDEIPEELRIDRKTFALQTYAKSIVAIRDFVTALKKGKDPLQGRLHLTRIVQDLVDIATDRVNFLIKLAAIKNANEYPYNHAANTCVLSIVLGKSLAVDRLALVDLGTSALLSNVAYAMLPAELVDGKRQLNDIERRALNDAMVRQIRSIIGQGRMLSDAMIRRIIVAYEHHLPYTDPQTGKPAGTHIFSRIVQVASAFDALTTQRPWREGFPADEALKILLQDAGSRYDPVIVRVLVNLMGLYPLGSCVKLASGEVAVVYHNSNDPRQYRRPWVKVLRDANGQRVRKTVIRNLAEEEGPTGQIVGPARGADVAGIDPGAAVLF